MQIPVFIGAMPTRQVPCSEPDRDPRLTLPGKIATVRPTTQGERHV